MEEDEDYQSLFFTECHELLADLQDHLDLLSQGGGDGETVNAAFRAVHSVKGGAAAFGFDQLISFAHVFETVMDKVRSNRLELTEEIGNVLLRAGDVMEQLVENAQNGSDATPDNLKKVLSELEEIGDLDPQTATGGAAPEVVATAAAPEADTEETELLTRELVFSLTPGPDFFSSGHDPLRLFRAARAHNLIEVRATGEVPDIDAFDPDICPLSWELVFETEVPLADIRAFFEIYDATAEIRLLTEEEEPATPEVPSEPVALAEAESKPTAPTAERPPSAEPAEDQPTQQEATQQRTTVISKSLRVELARIDRLVNLVGEMLITQAGLAQRLTEDEKTEDLDLGHSVDAMSRQLRELQESVMAIRAQSVKSVFSRMPRVVRDLSDKLGKEARLELAGEHTEVDTTVIEELAEPLTHMLRNSMDHGIEGPEQRIALGKPKVGTITLSAEHRGERVIIVIEDDGQGIDRDRVLQKAVERGLVSEDEPPSPEEIDQLIFHPGFSTAAEVSSVSGRGVGMDVVKKKIQQLGGRCTVRNHPGKGASFTITLPLTLAVMDGMTITTGGQQFVLPLSSVVEAVRLENCQLRQLPDDSTLVERRGEYLKLISLRRVLGMPDGQGGNSMAIIVDTETSGLVALQVDDLIGQRQVVLKSLEANFQRVEGVSGATILGDGHVALILDIPALLTLSGGCPQPQELVH